MMVAAMMVVFPRAVYVVPGRPPGRQGTWFRPGRARVVDEHDGCLQESWTSMMEEHDDELDPHEERIPGRTLTTTTLISYYGRGM